MNVSLISSTMSNEAHKLAMSELRMTWTFLIIASCYVFFTLPVTIADEVGKCQYIALFLVKLYEKLRKLLQEYIYYI